MNRAENQEFIEKRAEDRIEMMKPKLRDKFLMQFQHDFYNKYM